MNQYKIKVNFQDGTLKQSDITLVKGDYNSTEFIFEFDVEGGRNVFELKRPDGKIFIKDIIDNKIKLVDYDDQLNPISLIPMVDTYMFEITNYNEDSKLTLQEYGYFYVKDEEVKVNNSELEGDNRLPILDSLINDVEKMKDSTTEVIENTNKNSEYAKEQGDYAKEQAESVINANNQATEIINNFEKNVDTYTTNFNTNSDNKLKEYNDNHIDKLNTYGTNASNQVKSYNDNATSKINEYNTNHVNKLKAYNDNTTEKTTAYNNNHDSKMSTYNDNAIQKEMNFNTNAIQKEMNFNTNAETKVTEYNENHESKMSAYNENAATKVNEFNGEVESLREELNDYYNNQLVEQAEGTSIQLKDSADARMRAIEIDGNLKQETTIGKNLLPDIFRFLDQTINGITLKNNGNGSFTITGTATQKFSIQKVLSTEEILFNNFKLSPGAYMQQAATRIKLYNLDGVWKINTYQNFTTTEETLIGGIYLELTEGQTYNDTYWYQLEEGSVATTYEPYTGGQASPNLEYPQEIGVLEAKNLFNKYGDFTYGNSNNRTSLQDGTILSTSNFYDNRSSGILIENLESDTDYTLSGILVSANGTSLNGNAVIQILNKSNIVLATIHLLDSYIKPYNFTRSFNTGKNTEIWISFNGSNNSVDGLTQTIFDKIMLSKGTEVKPYVSYGCIQTIIANENLFNPHTIHNSERVKISDDGTILISGTPASNGYVNTNTTLRELCPSLKVGDIAWLYCETDFCLDTDSNNLKNWIYLNNVKENWNSKTSKKITQEMLDGTIIVYGGWEKTTYLKLVITKDKYLNGYVPHQEDSTEIDLQGNFIAKINDDIKDTLRIENGQAILTKRIGKFFLNGAESWLQNSGKTLFYTPINDILDFNNNAKAPDLISNYYLPISFNNGYSGIDDYGITYNHSQKAIAIRNKDYLNIEEFLELIKENPIEVYYPLEEPYEVDLGPIKLPKTFKGVSNIFLNANLETNMKIEYVKDTQLVIDNLQNQIDNIASLLSTTETSALLLDNLQSDLESEVI